MRAKGVRDANGRSHLKPSSNGADVDEARSQIGTWNQGAAPAQVTSDVARPHTTAPAITEVVVDLTDRAMAHLNGGDENAYTFPQHSGFYLATKRAIDVIVALIGILVLSPLFGVIAIAIKMDSRGSVFYRQTRVGMHRVPFHMWKFRKMPEDLAFQGAMVTTRWDHRMTRVGRVLERLKLDELPQLIDVLRGTMSIVGPRPDVPKFVEYYPRQWDSVLAVKPGIFGASQNQFRNESELYPASGVDLEQFYVDEILPMKLELDVAYAYGASLRRDAWLLMSGLFTSLFGALTLQTIVTRRAQVVSFAVLSGIGILGMVVAWLITEDTLALASARWGIILAVIFKPAALLALRIPKALATSMTPDDFRRMVWAALGSSAVIIAIMSWRFGTTFGYEALVVDALFFLCVMVVYKLFLYTFYLTFLVHDAWTVVRSVVWTAVVVAPMSAAAAMTIVHGKAVWTGQQAVESAMLVAFALVVRPVMLLLLRPNRSPHTNLSWLMKGVPRIVAASLVGSAVLLMGTAATGQSDPSLDVIALDALIFTMSMLGFAVWRRIQHPATSDDEGVKGDQASARLVVAGSGPELSSYVAMLDSIRDTDHQLFGVVTPVRSHRTSTVGNTLIIGGLVDLAGILTNTQIDVIALIHSSLTEEERIEVERYAQEFSVRVFSVRLSPDAATYQPVSPELNENHEVGTRVKAEAGHPE